MPLDGDVSGWAGCREPVEPWVMVASKPRAPSGWATAGGSGAMRDCAGLSWDGSAAVGCRKDAFVLQGRTAVGSPGEHGAEGMGGTGRHRTGRGGRWPPTYDASMTTVLLIRHGLTALTGSTLIGWTPGIHLDDRGRAQAQATAGRIRRVGLRAIVTSPLERCRETADAIHADRGAATPLEVDDRFGEVRYGDWTGGQLKRLAKDPLWKVIQTHPSSVTFPGGEAIRDVQSRAVAAIRDWNTRLGPDATYAVVSHADVIKLILADALGMHLDGFQRLHVGPASLSAVGYGEFRASVLRMNDSGDAIDDLMPTTRRPGTSRRGGGHSNGAEPTASSQTSQSPQMS